MAFRPGDFPPLRHRADEKKFIMLKSRIHYRAGFKPIAAHIVECAGAGVTNADLSVIRTTASWRGRFFPGCYLARFAVELATLQFPFRMSEAYNLLVDIGNTFVKWGRY